jgi:photosystem II stability/assembly factor-like uncharacterized protein
MAPRRYPFLQVPPGALMRAHLDVEVRFGLTARANMVASQMGLAAAWRSIGPTTINSGAAAGRVTAIAIHPTSPLTVYAGGAQGGVWKSTDGGQTWTSISDTQCSLAIGSITIDPVNPNIIYVGTGEQNNSGDSYYGCGLLRSIDGGSSWTQLGASVFVTTTGGARIGHIVIDRSTAGSTTSTTLLASTSFGLYRSTDSGQSWTRVLGGNVSGLVVDPVNTSVWYSAIGNYGATASQNGVLKSTDDGVTWTPLSLGITTTVGRTELAIAQSNGNVLYAAIEDRTPNGSNAQALLGIWRSVDAGATWVKAPAATASCAKQCWYDLAIAVDPTNAARVYMSGFSFYRSEDSANSFINIGTSVHVDNHAIAFNPAVSDMVYIGTDGGVYQTPNRGTTWANLNNGLAITQFYNGISLHPSDTLTVIGGTQDNGTLQYAGLPNWSSIIGGDGGYTAINPQTPAFMFGELEWLGGATSGGNGPRRADTPGGNFRVKNAGINTDDRAQFIPPYEMDQTNPLTLYFGTFRIYRTTDNAETWSPISPDLSKTGTGTVTTIGLSQTDAKTVYVGMNDGNVQVTRDSGLTWTPITSGLPTRSITQIVVDDVDPSTAYLTNSGFGTPHVWRTTDGTTWTSISGDLPNVPVNAVVVLPRTKELYIGTDIGMFRSTNGGTNWVPFMEGFPNVAVFALAFNDHTRKLVAATHGRGMFQYSLPALVLRGDVDGDGKITAADAQLVLMATVGLPLPGGVFAFPTGDVNCDGVTNALDAQIILSFLVGQPTSQFCINTIR